MAEDALVFFMYLQNTKNIISIKECLYKYYNNYSSIMNNIGKINESIKSERYVIDKICSINTDIKISQILIYRLNIALLYKKYLLYCHKYYKLKWFFRFILSINKKYQRLKLKYNYY
ncbi:hypothetical protein AVBRAN12654_09040 [Campylobacter sp. RM12654]|uniref:hypothetical protein n=1 Tax=Campylobacter sp. RM12654 TaxID=2735738 RepID=UPI0030150CEA|nr:hypothetical protein [Campylobacter sp. RM12654]